MAGAQVTDWRLHPRVLRNVQDGGDGGGGGGRQELVAATLVLGGQELTTARNAFACLLSQEAPPSWLLTSSPNGDSSHIVTLEKRPSP